MLAAWRAAGSMLTSPRRGIRQLRVAWRFAQERKLNFVRREPIGQIYARGGVTHRAYAPWSGVSVMQRGLCSVPEMAAARGAGARAAVDPLRWPSVLPPPRGLGMFHANADGIYSNASDDRRNSFPI